MAAKEEGKKLIISECLVKALAFDTKRDEYQIYEALMEMVDKLEYPEDWDKLDKVRRQFKLNGSSIAILVKFKKDSISVIPLRNKVQMAEDHTKFLEEIKHAYGDQDAYLKYLEKKLLTAGVACN